MDFSQLSSRWRPNTFVRDELYTIIRNAVEDSYKRLILPLLTRSYRYFWALLLIVTSPPCVMFPQQHQLSHNSSRRVTACCLQDQTDECCGERVHRHVCAEPATAPVGVSGQGVCHHGGGPRLQTWLQTGYSFPDQWVTTLGTLREAWLSMQQKQNEQGNSLSCRPVVWYKRLEVRAVKSVK